MASSPVSNLRRSFGNMLNKLSAKADSPDENKANKLVNVPCYVCSARGKKNKSCNNCDKVACPSHSGATEIGNLNRTCDSCIRIKISKDLLDGEVIKDKISCQIQELLDKRDQKTTQLNKQNTKVKNLLSELTATNEKKSKEKRKMISDLEDLREDNLRLKEDIEKWEMEVMSSEGKTEQNSIEFEKLEHESEDLRQEIDELIKERTDLLSSLNEIREFIRLQIPVKLIRKIVCSKCYFNVQNAFATSFKQIVPIKSEVSPKPSQSKKGACASCGVF